MSSTTKRGTQARRTDTGRTQAHILTWWITACAVVVAGAAITAVVLRPGVPEPPAPVKVPTATAVVATIDGQDIPVREFTLFIAQERAATFEHFQQAYAATDGPRFWTTPHGGTTPAAYLGRLALADAARATVTQQLAHRYGLLADSGYPAFVKAWTAENTRRADAVATGQVIYGPRQYTEANYFTYVLSGLNDAVEQKLAVTGAIPVTNAALRRYYTAHRTELEQSGGHDASATAPPFAQVREEVRRMYVHARYQDMLSGLARTVRVHVDQLVLTAVTRAG